MSPAQHTKQTREGHKYVVDGDVSNGLACRGVISPVSHMTQLESKSFDIIVVGAGYAGLTAARDLALAGLQVLLLEARDRIGGRTWTADVDGHMYEMGGTWIHWGQPIVWREMVRYGLHRDIVVSTDETTEVRTVLLDDNGQKQKLTLEAFDQLADNAFKTFCNVDGNLGKDILPFPHDPLRNPEARAYESLSASDRLEQIRGALTPTEICILRALIEGIAGSTDFNVIGFFDILRWWGLSGYSTFGLYEYTENFKIKEGQSHFAMQFFREALSTQRLSYVFQTKVKLISDMGSGASVTLGDGRKFSARRVVSTLPLNIMHEMEFDPPLNPLKVEASKYGQIHAGAKIHYKVGAGETRPFMLFNQSKSRIVSTLGDGKTESDGCRHMVVFGRSDPSLNTLENGKSFRDNVREALPEFPVEAVMWHDWAKDELAKGGWCMFRPGFSFRYLDNLRRRQGNILFASADWALGWRGFIDGAIEEGTRVAFEVKNELQANPVLKANL